MTTNPRKHSDTSVRQVIMLKVYNKNTILNPKGLMFPSYRNQSANFQSKSCDWFLYDERIAR